MVCIVNVVVIMACVCVCVCVCMCDHCPRRGTIKRNPLLTVGVH